MQAQNLWERTREYTPKVLYGVSTGMCLAAIGPNGHLHNPYNTFNLAVSYLIGREIPKDSNVHAVKQFRNIMVLFGGALLVPFLYNSIKQSGISLGDLLFDGSLWMAALGAEIERRYLLDLEDIVESPEEVPVLER